MEVLIANLRGGLCNKIICLSQACIIAEKEGIKILEPRFGWIKNGKWHKIKFSEIYDLDYFNERMKEFTNNKVAIEKEKPNTVYNGRNWKYYKKAKEYLWIEATPIMKKIRGKNDWTDTMILYVFKSLRLNEENTNIVRNFVNLEEIDAFHIRIESDWKTYAKKGNIKKRQLSNEVVLIDLERLIQMYKEKWQSNGKKMFFTTGENQENVKKTLKNNDIEGYYYYNNNLEYEINAAINFELCCLAKNFIGISSSTYSNFITLRRSLLNKNNSYIYNYKNSIIERLDKGLHNNPKNAIERMVRL
tara:strand:- start:226 stop:1134 length:909 start_codon:yes stop_codon:yes gene_type:complete